MRDVLPPVAEDDSPLTRSLDELLLVKPARIINKHTSKSLDASSHHFASLQESSSNESFKSAKSKTSDMEIEVPDSTQVPLENLPSECTLNPEVTNETLPSYDEDMFQVDTLPENNYDCDEIVTDILNDFLKSAIDEESEQLLLSQDSLELAAAVTSATTAQALIETIVEDSDLKIMCLKNKVEHFEQIEDQITAKIKDLETTYSENYAELQIIQAKEVEVVKLEASRQQVILENQLKDLKTKLSSVEAEISEKTASEADLKMKISNLENILLEKEKHCKEELEGVIAKLMQSEMISSAKNEVEEEIITEKENNETKNKGEGNFFDDTTSVLTRSLESNQSKKIDRVAMVGDLYESAFETPRKRNLFSTPPKREKPTEPKNLDLDATVNELKTLCNNKQGYLEKLESENKELKKSINELKKLCEEKQSNLDTLRSEYDNLKTDMEDLQKKLSESNDERLSLKLEQETNKNSLIMLCEENAKELEKLREENKFFKSSAKNIQNDLDENIKQLNRITLERDQLFAEHKKIFDHTNNRITTLEAENMDQKQLLDKINEQISTIVDEKDNLLQKHVALEATLAELRSERDDLLSKNKDLLSRSSVDGIDDARRSSLAAELENLRRKFMNEPSVSRLSDIFNWSKATDSTQYMDIAPWVPSNVACQTEESKRRTSLEQDLSNCWTERCEVEQQLAAALTENAILRQRASVLDLAGRRASGLIDAAPTVAGWLQLRSCIKEIVNQLSVLSDPEVSASFQTLFIYLLLIVLSMRSKKKMSLLFQKMGKFIEEDNELAINPSDQNLFIP